MKIRAGYLISYDCSQPTPMILQLSVHPSRTADLVTWDRIFFDPDISVNTYHDSFGNFCHVIRAPVGRLTMTTNFLVKDNGEPNAVDHSATQHELEKLPVNVLVYLLGSRYCETDRLSDMAWSLFGQMPKGWPLIQAICDYVHDHIKFSYLARESHQDGVRRLHRKAWRVPGLCSSGDRIMPMPQCSGPLLYRLSW